MTPTNTAGTPVTQERYSLSTNGTSYGTLMEVGGPEHQRRVPSTTAAVA